MYVDGNPLQYNDPTGNNAWIHMLNRIIGHMIGKHFGDKNISKRLSSGGITKGLSKATFISHDRWRVFENSRVYHQFGLSKSKEWFNKQVTTKDMKLFKNWNRSCSGKGDGGSPSPNCLYDSYKYYTHVGKQNPEETKVYLAFITIAIGEPILDRLLALIVYYEGKK
ncbi:hypothetical protein [Leptospira stimsonii]|uniref:hypothetical protein n=1 Tax=Leptospira stimsonii TaxID=2202203 RepID=UPI001F4DDE0C|nr:hypothetical protein [Leptospira stimsonii]